MPQPLNDMFFTRTPFTFTTACLTGALCCLGACGLEQEDPEDFARSVMLDARAPDAQALSPAPSPTAVPTATELDPDPSCTLEARPAAIVSVLEPVGASRYTLTDDSAQVLYRRWEPDVGAWGEIREARCLDDNCSRAALGYGMPGLYFVGAFACGDHALDTFVALETSDGCHVDTQYRSMVLDELAPACSGVDDFQRAFGEGTLADATPLSGADSLDSSACPLNPPKPSLMVNVGARAGDVVLPVSPERITSFTRGEQATPMACVNSECTMFLDGWDQPGTFTVDAMVCGERLHREVEVEQTLDGCDIETRWLGLYVDAEQCADEDLSLAQ